MIIPISYGAGGVGCSYPLEISSHTSFPFSKQKSRSTIQEVWSFLRLKSKKIRKFRRKNSVKEPKFGGDSPRSFQANPALVDTNFHANE